MPPSRARILCVSLALLALLAATMRLEAQNVAPLGAAERGRVLAASARMLDSLYVDRALARAMDTALRDDARTGRWDRIASPQAFADSVTARLRAIARDEHLRLVFDEHDPRLVENVSEEEKKRRYHDTMQEIADANFGLPEVRILAGNVALLRMDNFIVPWLGSPPTCRGDDDGQPLARARHRPAPQRRRPQRPVRADDELLPGESGKAGRERLASRQRDRAELDLFGRSRAEVRVVEARVRAHQPRDLLRRRGAGGRAQAASQGGDRRRDDARWSPHGRLPPRGRALRALRPERRADDG